MDKLNQVVNLFLEKNGVTTKYFATYINCEYTKCTKWLKGEYKKLNQEQIKRTHEFLEGRFLKSVQEIMKEG